MKPQHLAVICGKLDPQDPSGVVGVSLANDLVERGHRVTLLSSAAIEHSLDKRVELLTPESGSHWPWIGLLLYRRWVAKTLLDIQPVHTLSLVSTVPAQIIVPVLGLSQPSIALSRRHEKQALSSATLKSAIALSQLIEADLQASTLQQGATIVRAHLPIPEQKIDASSASTLRNKFARAWGLSPDAYWITLPFRTAGLSGLEPMLRAFKPLIDQGVDAVLLLAGPTRYTHLAWIGQLGLRDRVRFVGKTARIEELVSASDLVACPTSDDPVGWAVLPALASGKPIVTTNACGLADAVQQRGGSVLACPPEPVSLLEAMIEQHRRWQTGEPGQAVAQAPQSPPGPTLLQAVESLLANS